MNIREAKRQIQDAVTAYRTCDAYGRPMIPLQRQRPLFLLGAPGIGKTAIVEQVAREAGVALVSYAMTHHTRQSALGLPYIEQRQFGGVPSRVSEYTMSEIIASVYEKMEQTGLREGILFLDEINCVSETLTPAMLQFLQYKVFGRHRLPQGWIVVTAGNPPEYNRSVRDFDMATWDRLKRIDIEADFGVWREWAVESGVHPAVLAYLDIHRDDFCRIEATAQGREFVTPRGWVDLSDMIRLCELHGLAVDGLLIGQYVQCREIASRFAAYWELWRKYRSDYRIADILAGCPGEAVIRRAQEAPFDERISLVGLLTDGIRTAVSPVMDERETLETLRPLLERMKADAERGAAGDSPGEVAAARRAGLQRRLDGGAVSAHEEAIERQVIAFLEEAAAPDGGGRADLDALRSSYVRRVRALAPQAGAASAQMENGFAFCEKAFGEGQELLLLVTGLTAAAQTARFIAVYGSAGYSRHNRSLLFYERQCSVLREMDRLGDLTQDTQTPT